MPRRCSTACNRRTPESMGCSRPRSMKARVRSTRRSAVAVWAANIVAAPLRQLANWPGFSPVLRPDAKLTAAPPRSTEPARRKREPRAILANRGAYRAPSAQGCPQVGAAGRTYEYFLKKCLTLLRPPPIHRSTDGDDALG